VSQPQPSLLRAATPLFIGRGLSAALTFCIPIVLARAMAQAEYGTYKQFFLLAGSLYLVGQMGLAGSLYYFLPRHSGEERGRWLIQALAGLFLIGACAAAGTLIFTGALAARWSNPQLAGLALPLAIYIWAYLGAAPLEIALTACKRTGWAAVSYVLSDLVRTTALIGPILLGRGVVGLAWAAAGFAVLRLTVAWLLALSGVLGRPLAPSRAAMKAQLGYCLPFAGAVVLATAQLQLPQFVVAGLTDAATYAVFAVGVLQIPLADMVYTPIAEIMMVRLAQGDARGAPGVFREAVARLCMFFLPLCAFVLAVGPELIPTLYTAAYVASVPIFIIAMLEMPLSALPVDGFLRSFGATRTIMRIGVVRLVLAAVLVPVGFFTLGLPGTMIGYVASQWTAKTLLLVAAARTIDVPIRSLLPSGEVRAWTLRSAFLFGVVTLLRLHGPWHGYGFLIAASLAALLVWVGSLLAAGESLRWREVHV
jgi:O-antigen/teichoic acid export membrane protein